MTSWLLVAAALVALVRLLISGSRSALVAVLGFDSAALIWSAVVAWLLRDGLAPGYVPSVGWMAWARFAEGLLPALVVCSLIGLAAVWSFLRQRVSRRAA